MIDRIRFRMPLTPPVEATQEACDSLTGQTTRFDGHPALITAAWLVESGIEVEVELTGQPPQDTSAERLAVVAWALFAGEDATYVSGEYAPDVVETELAEQFLDTLASRGWTVTKGDGDATT